MSENAKNTNNQDMITAAKYRRLSVAVFSLFFSWLLALPFEGRILYALADYYETSAQSYFFPLRFVSHPRLCFSAPLQDSLNVQYIAMLLRIGDYIDIDEKRAPIELYRMISPTGFGDEEWKQHYIIENRDKIVRDEKHYGWRNNDLWTV